MKPGLLALGVPLPGVALPGAVAFLLAAALAPAPRQAPEGAPPAAAAKPAEARLVLETLAGALEMRPLEQPGELRFARDAIVFLRCEGPRPAPASSPARVELADGQAWCGDVAGGSGDTLRFQSSLGPVVSLSIDHVRRLEFPERVGGIDRASLAPAREGDRLYWAHAGTLERVDGTFEEFAQDGVVLDSVLGKRTFPWAEVGALFVAALDEDEEPAKVEGAPLVVDLADGSRLRGGFSGASPGGLRLDCRGAGEVPIPFVALLEAALDDGTLAFLGELEPAREEAGSLFGDELGLRWPHRVDRSVVGTPLSVAGERFARGIGVHAPSRLDWSLEPQPGEPARAARELAGMVGIDDSVRATSARGSVRFQVLVDGAVRWDSGIVRGGEPPRALPRIDLRGAKQLSLVVDPAEDSFVADRADWLRLVLVRDP